MLGISKELKEKILKDPNATSELSQDIIAKFKFNLQSAPRTITHVRDCVLDIDFNPNGDQMFLAGSGVGVYEWSKVLAADANVPDPVYFVEGIRARRGTSESVPKVYTLCFDPQRNLLLSAGFAGVIEYLNVETGKAGVLLPSLEEISTVEMAFTTDRNALCHYCMNRYTMDRDSDNFAYLRIWNYPALCKAAGLD